MISTLCLSHEMFETLKKITRATKSQIRMVFRAKIILFASEGVSYSLIVKLLNTTFSTVRKWINRFIQNPSLEALEDAHGSGRPFRIPAIAKCEVIKFACSDITAIDPDAGNTWTIATLQKWVKTSSGICISKSEISRILNHNDLKPHKVKMWLHSLDPLFQEKVS